MGVYLWTNEYSYDFRNKTQAQTEADGWTVITPYYTDANGWYSSGTAGGLSKPINLTNVKKITIVAEMNIASNSNALNTAIRNINLSISQGGIWVFTSGNSSSNKGIGAQILNSWKGWDNHAAISGATTLTYELDIQNLTLKATIDNNGNNWTRTINLTSSELTTATTNPVIHFYTDNQNHRLKSISCTTEE